MAATPLTSPSPRDWRTDLIIEKPKVRGSTPAVRALSPGQTIAAPRGRNWLTESLLEMSDTRKPRPSVDALVSVVLHILILAAIVLPPLIYTQAIDLRGFTQTFLVAPPPPPPPPPAAQPEARVKPTPRRTMLTGGKLLAPTAIPKNVAMIKEEPLPPEIDIGVAGGVPGGVPGGQMGGVIGGIITGLPHANVPPPPAGRPTAPIRVGGHIRPPRQLVKTPPVYPTLARQARMQGDVRIDAVIDTNGDVVEMKVISGPPLLIPAALDAVRQWKYEPTYLNDQPVAVQLIVTVTFQFQQ